MYSIIAKKKHQTCPQDLNILVQSKMLGFFNWVLFENDDIKILEAVQLVLSIL